jgi:hypothetical protein
MKHESGAADQGPCLIGLISDTHGLLRPQALRVLQGVSMIVHAGDIGSPLVLEELRNVAPVTAVRGNMDGGPWVADLPHTEVVQACALSLYVLHDLHQLSLDPAAAGFDVVVSGHSHRPSVSKRKGVLFVNPGSAGPSRFGLPISVAILRFDGASVEPQIIEIEP